VVVYYYQLTKVWRQTVVVSKHIDFLPYCFVTTVIPVLCFSELTSVMGAVAYICCVLMILFATVSVYRVSYFVNATLMTVALPSFLIMLRRTKTPVAAAAAEDANGKPKTE
jgi:hypothetical protein